MLKRRDFLKGVVAAGAAMQVRSLGACAAEASAADEKLILCSPLTHSDWMLKPGIEWGDAGVRHMLDACKAAGWSRVLWRVFDGGRAMYQSKIADPGTNFDADSFYTPQNDADKKLAEQMAPAPFWAKRDELVQQLKGIDYTRFDSLASAVDYGHKIGLQIHAWVSINEDDHAWGLSSRFSREHPKCRWVKRDGSVYRSQVSFAFPEVREYKLAIVKELLNYPIDGLFLDWIRTGDVRDNPQTDPQGVANSGYETPNIDAFKAKFSADPHEVPNDDPRWVAVRAEPQTVFMRELRKLTKLPICAMVTHPWGCRGVDKKDGNLRGLLLDVPTWSKEKLVDALIPEGYYRDGGTVETAYQALKKEAGDVPVWYFGWVPNNIAEFERDFAAAQKLGAPQLLFWEADYIDERPNAAELNKAMSARSL